MAAMYIVENVKPKLSSARKETKAPPPADVVGSTGVAEQKHPALDGVTFS